MKEEKKTCGCGEGCTCGDDCNCDETHKCNENCTCGETCTCSEGCTCGDNCTCDETHKCNENCTCGERKHNKNNCKKRVKELETLLEAKEKEILELKTKANQVLSTASYYKNEAETTKKDFERFKERNKNIEAELNGKASEEMAKKLLPVIDNFDKAFENIDEATKKGFEMIYNQMLEMLFGFGIEEISAEGELDPEMHNCITTEPAKDDKLDGKIATVYQKGYKFKQTNKVVRPSTVSVYKI